jgi:hypothetical protein
MHLRSALLGGLVAAVIVSALPALAAQVGDALSLGEANRVNGRTTLRGRALANLMIISEAGGDTNGTALDLRVKPGNPPMRVNSSELVESLNSDVLDGKHAAGFVGSSQVLFASVSSAGGLVGNGNALSAARNATGDYKVVFGRSTVGCAGTANAGFSDFGSGSSNPNTTLDVLMGAVVDSDPESVRVRIRKPPSLDGYDSAFHLVIVCSPE